MTERIEGVIQERIDRLENELRELLRVASVEGEKFTVEVLARIQEISDRELLKTLSDPARKVPSAGCGGRGRADRPQVDLALRFHTRLSAAEQSTLAGAGYDGSYVSLQAAAVTTAGVA
jgi:hypothetical protein